MNPEKLRAAIQAKQPKLKIIPQSVETFSNQAMGLVVLKFKVPADHLQYTKAQAMNQVKDLIGACKHLGAKVTQELKWE